jgi:Zn-dependent M32 family carboxypeptidase
VLLQDVHWSAGLFGYFPTYSLGAMYACQIYEFAKQQLPELEQQVAAGNFKPLRVSRLALLSEHAIRRGSRVTCGSFHHLSWYEPPYVQKQ